MADRDTQFLFERDVVNHLMDRHDWRLIEVELFCSQLSARAQTVASPDRDTLLKLAVNLYCENWYAACRSEGELRTRAFTELARYLYDRARHKYGNAEMAQEIAHEAIILVAEQLDHCQKPGAFLAFALLKLWNAATVYFRQRDRQLQRTAILPDTADAPGEIEASAPQEASPEEHAVVHDWKNVLFQRVGELMQQSPRAQQQFKAVLLKFLYAYSDEEIAGELATEISNVHVLRSRGLKRLREDPVLRQLFLEL